MSEPGVSFLPFFCCAAEDPQRSHYKVKSRSTRRKKERKVEMGGLRDQSELAFMHTKFLYSKVVNNCCDIYVHESFCCQI